MPLLLVMLLAACNSHSDSIKEQLQSNLARMNEVQNLEAYDQLVIIPRKGCSSCIGLADRYFKESRNEQRKLFVFTSVNSLKVLQLKLDVKEVNASNVLIDKKHLFSTGLLHSIYPLVVSLNSGKVESFYFLNRQNYGKLAIKLSN